MRDSLEEEEEEEVVEEGLEEQLRADVRDLRESEERRERHVVGGSTCTAPPGSTYSNHPSVPT